MTIGQIVKKKFLIKFLNCLISPKFQNRLHLHDYIVISCKTTFFLVFRTEKQDPNAFKKWLEAGEAPVLPETLHLYQNIQELGIEPVLLTERYQELEEVTLKNLEAAGFTYWRQVLFK